MTKGEKRKLIEATRKYLEFSWQEQYKIYLASDRWRRKRELVLSRDDHLCQSCYQARAEEVHHLTYKHVGLEPLFDLTSVCPSCHYVITKMDRGSKETSGVIIGALVDFLEEQSGIMVGDGTPQFLVDVSPDNQSKKEMQHRLIDSLIGGI